LAVLKNISGSKIMPLSMARLPGEYGLKSAVYGAEVKNPVSVPCAPVDDWPLALLLPLLLLHAASMPAAAMAAMNPAAQRALACLVIADTFLPGKGRCVAIEALYRLSVNPLEPRKTARFGCGRRGQPTLAGG
jgi:hypothetical protein